MPDNCQRRAESPAAADDDRRHPLYIHCTYPGTPSHTGTRNFLQYLPTYTCTVRRTVNLPFPHPVLPSTHPSIHFIQPPHRQDTRTPHHHPTP
jgi:hypothetical protein